MEKIGWRVEKIGAKDTSEVAEGLLGRWRKQEIFVFIKKLPFFPLSVVKVLRYRPPISQISLISLIKKHHPILVKLEPMEIEKTDDSQVYFKLFKKTSFPLTPTKTIWVDLRKSEAQLLKEMKPKTRYNIKKSKVKSQKSKVKIVSGNKVSREELNNFYQLWVKNKPHDWFFKPSYYELKSLVESFGNKCFLTSCRQPATRGQLLASCLVLTSKNMAFYWHNCSTKKGKKLFAPTLCVWEAIRESKKRKLKIFDFEGIWDERYPKLNKGWKGFTRFKLGFAN